MLNEEKYNIHQYKDVQIYIQKGINVQDNVEIELKATLPLLGSFFNCKGISIDN
ncbi:hypothetical protein [Caloramator mitchellensis]|uniref:hypothetical protein n=1 Tax=Caloramator mitchellensis TaxID=908809 RepID=UPI0013649D2E|nr:hypothetical protein [Caloramator mitchellensis]